jgi:hypothetical protein
MEIKDIIVIAKDFSDHPGARYKKDGEFSGEQFLEEILLPKFEKAVAENYILLVDLDKVFGYPSSFVSGSFGKLSVDKGSDLVLKHIQFKSEENPLRLEKIVKEIDDPTGKKYGTSK